MLTISRLLLLMALTLNIFPSVRGCSDTPSCDISVKSDFFPSSQNCKCFGDICDGGAYESTIKGGDTDCRVHCCEKCRDSVDDPDDLRLLEGSENGAEGIDTTTPGEPDTATSSPSTQICICYGSIEGRTLPDLEPCPTFPPENFTECSEECSSHCMTEFGELEDCEVAPLFIDEQGSIDDSMSKKLLSDWRTTGSLGSICVCNKMGFKIGKDGIADFKEGDCNDFCSQADSYGGVREWSTTIPLTSPPTATPDPQRPFGPAWAIAVFAVVVSIGFLMLGFLFCRPNNIAAAGSV